MTSPPTQSQDFPAFAPGTAATSASSSGFIKRLRSFMCLDWILGHKITAQAELICCRVRATRANRFSQNERFDIQIDYQFWVAGVPHQGQARIPLSGHYQSKSEAARAVLQQSSFPITYRTRNPSRSKLVRNLPVQQSPNAEGSKAETAPRRTSPKDLCLKYTLHHANPPSQHHSRGPNLK